ncbi:hypothetical protein [Bradyrhizobium sp.]|jgi:hypothetical protein|uniref:hypothetical protein n=1 Tax=Bradyrhizobium sp. TaxID=376 RepID=UPI003C229891
MAALSIGDTVTKAKKSIGKVVAIFTTVDGEFRYAVEHEGTLYFILETELISLQHEAA